MAVTNLLTLLDDIATVLDDVAVMTKVAARKTAGVLADDLALNAEQVSGVRAERELPVVWAVAKGSFRNKLILAPAALLLSAVLPWLITPLLMLGGLYLCFEGFEKVFRRFFHAADKEAEARRELAGAEVGVTTAAKTGFDLADYERRKIAGAIRTDFILSAEIIVIALGVVADAAFSTRVAVVCLIALAMTVGIYGLVAGIVKMDDAGLAMLARASRIKQACGRALLWLAPKVMRFLSIAGTIAMFLVGGGIIVHGIPWLGQWLMYFQGLVTTGAGLIEIGYNGAIGVIVGGLTVAVVKGVQRTDDRGQKTDN